MDNAYYEDLAGWLYGLVIRLSDRMPADRAGWVHHVTEIGEYALALEDLAAILAHGKIAITDQERADMLTLGSRMTATARPCRHARGMPARRRGPRPGQQIDHAMAPVRSVSPARGERAHVR
jgi:hypothetical protein